MGLRIELSCVRDIRCSFASFPEFELRNGLQPHRAGSRHTILDLIRICTDNIDDHWLIWLFVQGIVSDFQQLLRIYLQ